jgi:hypothetical protein
VLFGALAVGFVVQLVLLPLRLAWRLIRRWLK